MSQYGSDVCTLRERVMEGRPAGNERGEKDENEGGEMRWRERGGGGGGGVRKKRWIGGKKVGGYGKREIGRVGW